MLQSNETPKLAVFSLIDTDVHNAVSVAEVSAHLSPYWRQTLKARGRFASGPLHPSPIGANRKDANPPNGGAPGSDPDFLLSHHFDAYGVDYGVLNPSGILGISVAGDPDFANAVASGYNDVLIEKWLPHSPRFLGSILINHSDPAAAAKEIERVGAHPQIVQVLMASASDRLFGQRFYHPIYEAAQNMGLPVAVHPGTEGTGVAGAPTPAGYPTRYLEWHNILPINYMAQINSLVCEGVFEKFPRLKFIAIEGGIVWLAHLMWRMDKNYKGLRDTVPWLKRLPSEYIRESIYLTTQPIEEPENPKHMETIIEMIRMEERILFSSDYPHWDFDNPKMALPPFSREVKAKILWQNAAQLYNLKPLGTPKTEVAA